MEDPLHVVCSPVDAEVVEILVKAEMDINAGQPMFVLDSQVPGTTNVMREWEKSLCLKLYSPQDVLKRYENFKKFDTVVDYTHHLFSAQFSSASFQLVQFIEWIVDCLFRSVRYNCRVPGINPPMKECGDVSLYLSDTTGRQEMWVPRTSNMLQLLVSIQGLILNTRPSLNTGLGLDLVGEMSSTLYNEDIVIKSLQAMMCSMNKPPKNFEDLVVGHFSKHIDDILRECEAYTKGYQVNCLVSGKNDGFSTWCIEGVAACIKPLVEAFKKTGLMEVQEFCYQIEEKGNTLSPANASAPDIDIRPDDGHCHLTLRGVTNCVVDKVLVNVGERVEKGKPLFVMGRPSMIRQIVAGSHSLGVGILSMEDVRVMQDEDAENIPMAGLDNKVVLKKFRNFKKFGYVKDHSDHIFSSAKVKRTKDWTRKIKEEWKILKEHLPENIFVRVYKSRKDLLRAVIVGRKETPYIYGLFFFDVFFPSDYPNSPPLVCYHSGGLGINPNLGRCGKVDLSLPKTSGGQETLWVPGTSTILQLLVSIQQRVLNETPLFNERRWAIMRGTEFGTQTCIFYSINTLIRSMETMVYIINKTPKVV